MSYAGTDDDLRAVMSKRCVDSAVRWSKKWLNDNNYNLT